MNEIQDFEILVAVFAMGVIAVPGFLMYARTRPNASIIESYLVGQIIGVTFVCVGLVLSMSLEIYSIRWLPSLLFLVFSLRSANIKGRSFLPTSMSVFSVCGSVIASSIYVISIIRYLPQTYIPDGGYWSLDTDLQFYFSLASESIHRVPDVFPSAAKIPISYTWLFSGFIGSFSGITRIQLSTVLFVLWPFFYAIVMPLLICLVTFKIVGNSFVAFLSPIAYAVLSGPQLPSGVQWLIGESIMMNSPHRDFGQLMFLSLVLYLMSKNTQNFFQIKKSQILEAAVIFVLSFTATGSKGSMFLIVGFFLVCSFIFEFLNFREIKRLLLPVFAGICGCILAQTLVVSGIDGSNSNPKYFFAFFDRSYGTEHPKLTTLVFVSELVVWLLVPLTLSYAVNFGRQTTNFLRIGSVLSLACLLSSVFLHVHGLSQFYLVQGVIPLLTICMTSGLVFSLKEFGSKYLYVVVVLIVIYNLIQRVDKIEYSEQNFLLLNLLLHSSLVIFPAALALSRLINKGSFQGGLLSGKVALAILSLAIAFQSISIPMAGSIATGYRADESSVEFDPSNPLFVSSDQIQSLVWLRDNTNQLDLIATNKHCSRGLTKDDCSERWFLFSALSERRFLIEGLGYVGGDVRLKESYRDLSDQFISYPNDRDFEELAKLGVDYLFVDLRLPHSEKLGKYCVSKIVTMLSLVCELRPQ